MTTIRTCRVSVTTPDGVTHAVDVQGTSVFEAAAAAVARMRDEGWAGALPPDAVLHVEVQLPLVVHEVPMKTLERWANGPSVSPKQKLLQQQFRK